MQKIIIGLTGKMASGKTTVTDYLKEKHKAVSFRFSDMLRDMLERIYLPLDRKNMQTMSTILRQNFGEDIMAKVLTSDVRDSEENFIITEGIRRPSDVEYLKELPNFYIIAIDTDQRLRFERLTKRSENPDDQNKTWEQFQHEDSQEAEEKIAEIMEQADFKINNNNSLKELYIEVDKILNKIKSA